MELPLDLNDDKIATTTFDFTTSRLKWTDSTFSLIRYECYEVHRQIFRDREEIKHCRSPFSPIAKSFDARCKRIEEQYLRYLDDDMPLQRCVKSVGRLLLARSDLMLHKDHLPRTGRSENQLRIRDRLVFSSLPRADC